jgi:hypothetical protein
MNHSHALRRTLRLSPEGADGNGSGDPPATPPATPPAGGGREEGDGDDLTGLKSALEKERADRKKFEREFKQLSDWKRAREQADMSEGERTAARLKEYEEKERQWERERRDLRLQTAITATATKAGALNPEILHRLVDYDGVEWNDATGQPKNLTAVVNELKREYPAMFRAHGGAGSADAGAGTGGGRAEASMNSLIRRAAGRE